MAKTSYKQFKKTKNMHRVSIFLISALTVAIFIMSASAQQQQQDSTHNQSVIAVFDGNMTAGEAKNITEIKAAVNNIKNVSIVPNAGILEDKAYQPNPVQIEVGETIIWANNDSTTHTITEGNPSTIAHANGFDSGLLSPDLIYKHVFDKAGTIEYHCTLHPTMEGKIIVSQNKIVDKIIIRGGTHIFG